MKHTKWSKDKENYAAKSSRIWIATTEKNVKGMCKTKQWTIKTLDIFDEECGRKIWLPQEFRRKLKCPKLSIKHQSSLIISKSSWLLWLGYIPGLQSPWCSSIRTSFSIGLSKVVVVVATFTDRTCPFASWCMSTTRAMSHWFLGTLSSAIGIRSPLWRFLLELFYLTLLQGLDVLLSASRPKDLRQILNPFPSSTEINIGLLEVTWGWHHNFWFHRQ